MTAANPKLSLSTVIISITFIMGAPAHAQSTKLPLRLITIQGDDNINATSVNAQGTIVATLYAGITDAVSGVKIVGKTVTTLPQPDGWAGFNPRVINDKGDILGWARHAGTGQLNGTDMFLLQGTTFNTAYQYPLIEPGSNIAGDNPLPMDLTNNLKVSFNTLVSLSGPVGTSYGKPPHLKNVPPLNRFVHVNSINESGTVAGVSYSFSGISSVYEGVKGAFTTIAPPNASRVAGGWLNKSGALAGSFEDTTGWHGFVYAGGTYTVFDMPVTATSISTTAINNAGRVVGSFVAANGTQRAFLYNGSMVTAFGRFPETDTITLAIGNGGTILVSDEIPASDPKFLSYKVTCSGVGC
jgi:probable HAF family extracellular repeat protein